MRTFNRIRNCLTHVQFESNLKFENLALISLMFLEIIAADVDQFVNLGRKCRLQEQHCDIMHPEKQCCPGTSCGVKLINNDIVNICLMCRDIGQPCGNEKGACCRGLKCEKITQYASVCNPTDLKLSKIAGGRIVQSISGRINYRPVNNIQQHNMDKLNFIQTYLM